MVNRKPINVIPLLVGMLLTLIGVGVRGDTLELADGSLLEGDIGTCHSKRSDIICRVGIAKSTMSTSQTSGKFRTEFIDPKSYRFVTDGDISLG